MTVLFVYGSLKRGHRNHRLLADQQFLGAAVTEPRYRLVDLGTYPGMIDDPQGVSVTGELWAVGECALAELDDFECADAPYYRAPVAVAGRTEPAEAYFFRGITLPGARTGATWPFD
jgi:gamma-glutamylaminecyclotransferase